VCPKDGKPLADGGDVLTCSQGHRWNVVTKIPRMIPASPNYSDAFGLQWKAFRRTQLDSFTGTTLSRDRTRRCAGDECWEQLHGHAGRHVLEVGCGAGRFTEILLATGACVTSVDLSAAVEANQENFPQDERHRILRADVRHLPFAEQQYDVVICLGVIQHTPDPEETIQRLYDQVRPGGWLVLDHYARSVYAYTRTAFLFRMVLRRLPPGGGLKWSQRLVDMLLPLHKAVGGRSVARRLLSHISPVAAYYGHLPLNDDLQREWAVLDTHDSLTDWYKHRRTRNQIRRALERMGAESIWCEYGGNGVEARCKRPTA
jgi:2-polyprenyl-3-methyl-5-hydroxy-6-metoxy-1,4-benzoquinol methylase